MVAVEAEILDEIVRRLVKEFDPQQIILFGSHAWGDPDADSDLDLLVVVSESSERPTERAWRAHRCLHGIRVPMDILVKTREEFDYFRPVIASLEHRIAKEGKVLYG